MAFVFLYAMPDSAEVWVLCRPRSCGVGGTIYIHGLSRHVGVLQARAGVEHDHAVCRLQKTSYDQIFICGGCSRPFRREKDSFAARPVLQISKNLFIGYGDGDACGLAQYLEHDVISVRLGDAQASSESFRVLPHFTRSRFVFERANHRSTA